MKKKELLIVITVIGGVLIILSPFLPLTVGIPTLYELALSDPRYSASLLFPIAIGTLVIVLSIFIGVTKGRLHSLCWGSNVALTVYNLLKSILWWLLARYQPFASTIPAYTGVPGLGVYCGLAGSLLALASLIFYKLWR